MDTFLHYIEVDAFPIIAGGALGGDAFLATAPISHFTPWTRLLASPAFFGW
jgi:hypothetical protein